MDIYRIFTFDAAHRLPGLPADHPCSHLHGHTYNVEVQISGDIPSDTGWVMDFRDMKKACAPVFARLDHCCLNDVQGLENPTSENIALWLWRELKPVLPGLSMIDVRETAGSGCRYRG